MSNGVKNPLRNVSRHSPPSLLVDPLEEAYEAAKDAQNIIRDAKRRERSLHSYSDEEEITQTELHTHVHVYQHPSKPDLEVETSVEVGPVKVSGLPKWAIAAIGLLLAAGAAMLSHFFAK